jgi:ribosomal protein L7Ae-like RNA K-turn-binding protein
VVSIDDLVEGLVEQLERRGRSLVLSAVRRKAASLGTEASRDALSKGRAALLVIARDAASAREDLEHAARAREVAVCTFGTKHELGGLVGRSELGFLTIGDAGIAAAIEDVCVGVSALSEDG